MKLDNLKGGLMNAGKKIGSAANVVASGTKEVTSNTLRKAQAMRQDALYKKYNPLFPEEYTDFGLQPAKSGNYR